MTLLSTVFDNTLVFFFILIIFQTYSSSGQYYRSIMHFDRYNIDRRALEEAVCVHAAGHANRLQSFRVHNLSPWDSRIRFGAYDLGEGLRGSYLTPPLIPTAVMRDLERSNFTR